MDEHYEAKVSDFGLSRVKDLGTMTSCVGTPQWMAPEVLQSKSRYSEKADVYSFGVVLFELITKERPFHGIPAIPLLVQMSRGLVSANMFHVGCSFR